MKKLIKKILNYFGYYNQKDIDQKDIEYSKQRNECIKNKEQTYFTTFVHSDNNLYEFRIFVYYSNPHQTFLIKSFTTDDYDYGVLCADECVEMLYNSH